MALFLGIPILMFVFKEPLGNLVKHNHKKIEGGKGMFFCAGFFELFETLLSLFLKHTVLCTYRCICSESCCHDGSGAYVIGSGNRKPELVRRYRRKYFRMSAGRTGCRNSGIET